MDGGRNAEGFHRSWVPGPLLSLCTIRAEAWFALPAKSQYQTETGLAIVSGYFYYGHNFYAQPGVSVQDSSLKPTGF